MVPRQLPGEEAWADIGIIVLTSRGTWDLTSLPHALWYEGLGFGVRVVVVGIRVSCFGARDVYSVVWGGCLLHGAFSLPPTPPPRPPSFPPSLSLPLSLVQVRTLPSARRYPTALALEIIVRPGV